MSPRPAPRHGHPRHVPVAIPAGRPDPCRSGSHAPMRRRRPSPRTRTGRSPHGRKPPISSARERRIRDRPETPKITLVRRNINDMGLQRLTIDGELHLQGAHRVQPGREPIGRPRRRYAARPGSVPGNSAGNLRTARPGVPPGHRSMRRWRRCAAARAQARGKRCVDSRARLLRASARSP